jgi:lon-related putative ATP-dependent protease
MAIEHLAPESLFTVCDAKQFSFKTTAELPELEHVVGQERAVEAIRFGIGIKRNGYNLYVLGPDRSGKRSVVRRFIEQQAKDEPTPQDWCYVFNFADPQKPNAIPMPPGRAVRFQADMNEVVTELGRIVPDALESDEYRSRLQEIQDAFSKKQDKAFSEMHDEARAHNLAMLRTPAGFAFAPLNDKGKTISPEEYNKLSDAEKEKIEQTMAVMQERLQKLVQELPKWRRETNAEIRKLNHDVVMAAVGQLIDELRHSYADLPEVLEFLDLLQADVIEHADNFRRREEGESNNVISQMFPGMEFGKPFISRYQVNVVVDNTDKEGAPVHFIDHPSYPNLVGRVEHEAQMGALVTDFTMIKPGALHKTNGGYLIMDITKVLTQPYAWEGLKRVLKTGVIKIESLGQALSLISASTLEPEPIPLDIKVVLLGDRRLYYLLCELDPEFNELFKVAADFDNAIERSKENVDNFALWIANITKTEELRPLTANAVARVIEEGSREVEDASKLSSRFGKMADFLREADYWAGKNGNGHIDANEIEQAVQANEYRLSRIRERVIEETLRGTLVIATEGEMVGQVNGLTVAILGDYEFGHPSRITATAHIGKGEVIDIEREIELGGPIHSKGVLILSGFISARYCQDAPLSLNASLVFEQTYGGVEGDSASSAELFVLLSALADVPIKQSLAVTGSVNQLGHIQAIGGVNEKIEGFYEVCKQRGLTGDQGVIIPKVNVPHLMLRQEVRKAVADGKFHVYAIETVDDGLELLSGLTAGERAVDGSYPEGSFNQKVESRLQRMAERAREHEK